MIKLYDKYYAIPLIFEMRTVIEVCIKPASLCPIL